MAAITADSELMTNYIAAVPVPAGAKFKVVLDQNRRPMVLSLSNDSVPKLQLIRTGTDGAPVLLHLASNLGIQDSDGVQAFDICQANDLRLFLTVAYGTNPSTSTLLLTQAFMPQDLKPDTALPLLPGQGGNVGTVESIYITPVRNLDPTDYPTSYVFHKSLDNTVSWGSDITEVYVQSIGAGWSLSNRMSPPENLDGILSVSPAANAFGKGLFVLYKVGSQTKLYARFLRPDPNDPTSTITFVTSVWCPTDASCIATVWTPGNRSALLIASPEGLRYMTPSQSTSKNQGGVVLTQSPLLSKIAQMQIAQDGDQLSIWFRTTAEELGYLRGDADELSDGVVSLLLGPNQASSFAASVAQPDRVNGHIAWQTLVSDDDFGNLTLLEQALDTGIWKTTPFYTPSNTQNIAVQSYTITLHARDDQGQPIKDGQMYIKGSSSVSLIYNGRNTILPSTGGWYAIDSNGSVNFIVASQTLASQSFHISQLKKSDGSKLTIAPFTFNPAGKAMNTLSDKMANIKTAADFRAAKTQNGNSIFGADAPDDDTLNTSIKVLGNIKSAYNDMPADGSVKDSSPSAAPPSAPPAAPNALAAALDSVEDAFWDAWHWVKEKAHEAYDWVVEKVGEVWRFVCTIAGEIKNFVLDCMEKVGEAMTWVFNKIKAGWDTLVEWIGFIFSWGDIVECKDTISSIITAGVDLGASKIDAAAIKVDNVFAQMLANVDKFMTVPNASASLSGKSGSDADKGSTVGDTTSSTKFNWTGERLKNGGGGTSTSITTSESSGTQESQTWSSVFQPALDGVKASVEQVGHDIRDLFHKQGSITAGDFMNLGKDIIKLAITTIRGLVSSLLKLLEMVLQKISKYGNASINIPIFSALYRDIAHHDLTIFDAVSLIIAIPTTIFTKIITNHKPPQIPGMNGDLLGQILLGPNANGQEASAQTKLDFNTLTAGITVSGVMVSTIVHVIKLAYKSATKGSEGGLSVFKNPGGFMEIFSIVADMIGTLHAMPKEADLPGAAYREWIASISLIRGATHLLVLYTGGGEAVDKALLVFDLLSALANFGLQQAVYAAETEARNTWKEYDEETNGLGIASSGLNAIAAVGYFGAFMAKLEEPEVAAVGMVVLEVGTIGKAVVDGVVFRASYDKGHRALLMPYSS